MSLSDHQCNCLHAMGIPIWLPREQVADLSESVVSSCDPNTPTAAADCPVDCAIWQAENGGRILVLAPLSVRLVGAEQQLYARLVSACNCSYLELSDNALLELLSQAAGAGQLLEQQKKQLQQQAAVILNLGAPVEWLQRDGLLKVYNCPSPAAMLHDPGLKRQAWQTLKALQLDLTQIG